MLLPFVAVALVLVLGPGIEHSKDERARTEAQQLERQRDLRDARIRVRQQPRFARGAVATDVAGRERLLGTATGSVASDARARAKTGALKGPIRRVTCEPFPRTVGGVGAERSLDARFGNYSCLAVTSEVARNERSQATIIGHPYRMRIDFESGRYAFCNVVGRAGEMSITSRPPVPVPRACGGR